MHDGESELHESGADDGGKEGHKERKEEGDGDLGGFHPSDGARRHARGGIKCHLLAAGAVALPKIIPKPHHRKDGGRHQEGHGGSSSLYDGIMIDTILFITLTFKNKTMIYVTKL